ncbi:uncharacterized protein LOC119575931 [Penaeus monodon]|uniref:uncharacterized protein LOC119575931 n=1 Tax=Penaeus monodon TaxID=6687 RepID=UPI0018A7D905|nr:uncharacterized protein LOC119575931 [Penaeus monodon]
MGINGTEEAQGAAKSTIQIDGLNLKRVDHSKYLGEMVEEDGSMGREIKHRIQCGWNNWRKVSGVVCDKRVPVKLNGKVHKSVVRPAMTYGLETAPLRKVEERKLEVAEMKMLRWMVGVTKMDCIRSNYIRGSLKVTEILKNIQESRLRCYGHLLRRNECGKTGNGDGNRGKQTQRKAEDQMEGCCSKRYEGETSRRGRGIGQNSMAKSH